MSESPRNTVPKPRADHRNQNTRSRLFTRAWCAQASLRKNMGKQDREGFGINSVLPLAPCRRKRFNPDPGRVESARWPLLAHRWRLASRGRGHACFQSRPEGRIFPLRVCCPLSTLGFSGSRPLVRAEVRLGAVSGYRAVPRPPARGGLGHRTGVCPDQAGSSSSPFSTPSPS